MSSHLQVQFLVVGAGPSGAALASFLGQYGFNGLVISKAASTADTPRAHSFNPFAFECLRDLGIEQEAQDQAMRDPDAQRMRWVRSMIGEEYGKVQSWRSDPSVMGATVASSPSEYAEFPQSLLEPLLVKYASHHNFHVRFSTELVSFERVANGAGETDFLCTIRDLITQHTFTVQTRYLFGADGARSQVARTLDFKFNTKPSGMKACNVLLRMEIGHHLSKERQCGLHWIIKPDRTTFPGLVAHFRVVRPWNEWLLIAFGPGGTNPFEGLTPESPELIDCVRELVGDDTIKVEILRLDPWMVRESVAEQYSDGNAFIMGDAAHRHPPAFGLGSNTCIQDAYNLAWKVAYVSKGLAGPGLLESFSKERQPVGAALVNRANVGIRSHPDIWKVLGMFADSPEAGTDKLSSLYEATPEGEASRATLCEALENVGKEGQALGAAYNQWYTSDAVYLDDERDARPALQGDPMIDIQVSTYPGSRLPHAWVDVAARQRKISTHDLAGKNSFVLITGIGGGLWREAAEEIAKETGIPLKTYGIGFGLDYIDIDRDWRHRRGVDEDGAVLVRPDRFVAWRSTTMISNPKAKLQQVLDQILSRDGLQV